MKTIYIFESPSRSTFIYFFLSEQEKMYSILDRNKDIICFNPKANLLYRSLLFVKVMTEGTLNVKTQLFFLLILK